jgi:hypothetical protein
MKVGGCAILPHRPSPLQLHPSFSHFHPPLLTVLTKTQTQVLLSSPSLLLVHAKEILPMLFCAPLDLADAHCR